jgi:4-amino-4-deoxychorismate lyase
MEGIRILNSLEEIISAAAHARPVTSLKLLAFYDSRLDVFITHPAFMSVPINDYLIDGYGVFDTAISYHDSIYQLDRHLERLIKSATLAHIIPPLPLDLLRTKVTQLVELAHTDCRVRLFVSGGLASPEIDYSPTSSIFYALAYNDAGQSKPAMVKEVTVSVPAKPRVLSVVKSNNYMINALCVLEAREKGGYMGIQLSDDGYILDSAISNICAVLKGGHLRSPPPDQVLDGTTVKRIYELAKELVKDGSLLSVERGMFTVAEAQEGQELMMVGGDGIVGISHLNGVQIGNGEQGPVTRRLKEILDRDKQ